jgi:signal transduction histidine kinase
MFSSLSSKLIPSSLSGRLTFLFSLTFIVLLMLSSAGLYLSMGSLLDQHIEEDLQEDIEEFQVLFESGGMAALENEIERETYKDDDQLVEFFQLYNQEGGLLFSSAGTPWQKLRIQPELLNSDELENEPLIETLHSAHSEYPIRTMLGKLDDNLYMYSGETTEARQDVLDLMVKAFLIAFFFILPLAGIIVWWVAGKSSEGIEIISHSVAEIEQGNLEVRVKLDSPVDEISHLATAFNNMAERIKSLINEMREMIDNIAHDLRSPLGRIRAISENALISAQKPSDYIRAAENTLGECDRLLRLINTTLDVAEVEAGVYMGKNAPVDLGHVVAEACELFEPVAQDKQLQLSVEKLESCIVEGNLNNLQRMVSNLIDNAIKYTPEKGNIRVNMLKDKNGCRIQVADTGIGISEINQPRIFERFYRCDESRTTEGCGLGLSFSRAVAKQYGGDILLQSKPNESTVFTILLPC